MLVFLKRQAILITFDVEKVLKLIDWSEIHPSNKFWINSPLEIMKLVGSVDVTMKIFEGCRHELLNELNKYEVYEYILNWLDEKTPSK